MPTFRIVEVETTEHVYEVEAETEEEAMRRVEDGEEFSIGDDYDSDFEIIRVERMDEPKPKKARKPAGKKRAAKKEVK